MAYKRILFGTDGSASAQAAGAVALGARRAGRSAADRGVRVRASHRRRTDRGDGRRAGGGGGRPPVSGEARAGVPADALIALADGHDVGLVVVSGGRGKKYGLGQVAHRLSVRSPRDVLLVSGSASLGSDGPLYRRVLIATDGSSTADRAARKGFELAEALEAPVTIVFVGHPKTGELDHPGHDRDVRRRGADRRAPAGRRPDGADPRGGRRRRRRPHRRREQGHGRGQGVPLGVGAAGGLRARDPRRPDRANGHASGVGARSWRRGIVERAGEKLAVYVGDDGEAHVMSARCTHMGCTVAWNPGERTFDCPCHGSRFGPTGEVVNGPAARPLPPA